MPLMVFNTVVPISIKFVKDAILPIQNHGCATARRRRWTVRDVSAAYSPPTLPNKTRSHTVWETRVINFHNHGLYIPCISLVIADFLCSFNKILADKRRKNTCDERAENSPAETKIAQQEHNCPLYKKNIS